MPYGAYKRGDKFVVRKKGPDGPEGDVLGEHDTKQEAFQQIAAIEANEADKADKADWRESDRPRDEGGQFGHGGGGGGSDGEETDESSASVSSQPQGNVNLEVDDAASMRMERYGGSSITPDHIASFSGADGVREAGMDATATVYDGGTVWLKNGKLGDKYITTIEGDGIRMERSIILNKDGTPSYIENYRFELGEEHQGAGKGTEIFYNQAKQASEAGFSHITTQAARSDPSDPDATPMNGYYTWARMGYDAPINPRSVLWNEPPPRGVLEGLSRDNRGDYHLSDIMRTPEGRSWWKANGTTTDMEFDLTPGSRSMQILEAYQRERASRKAELVNG